MSRRAGTSHSLRAWTLFALVIVTVCGQSEGAEPTAPSETTTRVVTVVAGGAAIPTLRIARGRTTMVSFPSEAREAVCGDLYDPQSGSGGIVVERSGRDLFIKPLRGAVESNLFVKTDAETFAFELVVVAAGRAMRIVHVEPPTASVPLADPTTLERERATLDADRSALERERRELDDQMRRHREDLERDVECEMQQRVDVAVRASLLQALRSATFVRTSGRGVRSGALTLELAADAADLGGRVYLPAIVRNRGAIPIVVAAIVFGTSRQDHATVIPPSGFIRIVAESTSPIDRHVTLRLLDPGGHALLTCHPFDR